MSDKEKMEKLMQEGSDLFDEMSIAALELVDEDDRIRLRKMFSVGFLQGWAQGHLQGSIDMTTAMLADRAAKKEGKGPNGSDWGTAVGGP